jgi:hypothetical protein
MSEEQRLELRFHGESLGSYTYNRGVAYRLFKRSGQGYDYYVIHHDDPEGPAWLEDGRSNGLSEGEVRMMWPELARCLD